MADNHRLGTFLAVFRYKMGKMTYDIAIIGSGLVGAAIAHDLVQWGLKVVVLEREGDLGAGASRSNSGVLHTGFDSKPGTLETQLIRKQAERWVSIFDQLGVPYKKVGAVLLAKNDSEVSRLETIQLNAQTNGVATHILSKKEFKQLEPHAIAQAALHIPGESMTDPYEVMRRLLWGIELRLNTTVTGLEETVEGIRVVTPSEHITAGYVVNCAGLFADELTQEFRITPRRGEFIVFDKSSSHFINHILLPMPNDFTKGVLVFPTLYGYLCAGPSANDQDDKTDWTPHADMLPVLHQKAAEMLPELNNLKPVSAWAGLRTVGHPHNYFIEFSKTIPNLLHVAGIRSTGLSACLGISDYVMKMLKERLEKKPPPTFNKPTFSDSQPWWERLNTLRNVDINRVLEGGRS
jgi:glycerol-3-phosphate dehydrogenase